MPRANSQIAICDLPIRFDTYEGCSHLCSYCFVLRKNNLKIKAGESAVALKKWVEGNRPKEFQWCDWNIPIHWGGVSDPFQPIERKEERSLNALRVFAQSKYPFVVSTKSALIATEPYISLIKQCNCVIQISAVCPRYNQYEKGASPYEERMRAIKAISPHKRVVIRVQPYIPDVFIDVMREIRKWAELGVYGITIEGMKYVTKQKGINLVKIGSDMCYQVELLKEHYEHIKEQCHKYGMRFFCAENRLRAMGDSLCCCGIEGLGWQENTANLNHLLYDAENVKFTEGQKKYPILNFSQKTISWEFFKNISYEDAMKLILKSSKVDELKPIK